MKMDMDITWLLLASCGLSTAAWLQNSSWSGQIETECRSSTECQKTIPNATCSDGICTCETGFFMLHRVNTTTCEPNDAIHPDDQDVVPTSPDHPTPHVDPNMIIIMAVLAVMFLGICVALHLFSKARFRNHRTIFNSPHPRIMHIKLGKKRGQRRPSHVEPPTSRQHSICSQLSPLQSRRGSQSTSPDYRRKPQVTDSDIHKIVHQPDHASPRGSLKGSPELKGGKGPRPAPQSPLLKSCP